MSAGVVLGIAACAICAAVFSGLVKTSNREFALLLSALTAVLILARVAEEATPVLEQLRQLGGGSSLPSLCLTVMLKAVGLTMAGRLAASLCKDAGESALAYGVEAAVRVAVIAAALPLLSQLLEYLGEILQL